MKHQDCGGEFVRDMGVTYEVKLSENAQKEDLVKSGIKIFKRKDETFALMPKMMCSICGTELFETTLFFDPDNRKLKFLLPRDMKKNEDILFGFPLSKKDGTEFKIVTVEVEIPYDIIKGDWISITLDPEHTKMMKEGY